MMIYSLFNEDFNKVRFISNQRHILAVDLDEINLDEDCDFDEYDPDTIIHVRLLAGVVNLKNLKHLQKDKRRINVYSVAS